MATIERNWKKKKKKTDLQSERCEVVYAWFGSRIHGVVSLTSIQTMTQTQCVSRGIKTSLSSSHATCLYNWIYQLYELNWLHKISVTFSNGIINLIRSYHDRCFWALLFKNKKRMVSRIPIQFGTFIRTFVSKIRDRKALNISHKLILWGEKSIKFGKIVINFYLNLIWGQAYTLVVYRKVWKFTKMNVMWYKTKTKIELTKHSMTVLLLCVYLCDIDCGYMKGRFFHACITSNQ